MRPRLFSIFSDGLLAAELRLGRPYYAQERELRAPSRQLYTVRHLYVWPAYRGQGYASRVISDAVQQADLYRWDLALYVARIGRHGMSTDELIRLYESHGFELTAPIHRFPGMVRRWREPRALSLEFARPRAAAPATS